MCASSAIMEYGRRDMWPNHNRLGPNPYWPDWQVRPLPPVPPTITPEYMREFLRLFKAAQEFDAATGQPECEDPEKLLVLKRIEERLDAIERQLATADPTPNPL